MIGIRGEERDPGGEEGREGGREGRDGKDPGGGRDPGGEEGRGGREGGRGEEGGRGGIRGEGRDGKGGEGRIVMYKEGGRREGIQSPFKSQRAAAHGASHNRPSLLPAYVFLPPPKSKVLVGPETRRIRR